MLALALVVIGFLVVLVVVLLMVRSFARAEGRLDAELHEAGVPTLRYSVPVGQDPAVLVAALSKAGFKAVADLEQGTETLLVEVLEPGDRARVRAALEQASRSGFEGARTPVAHVDFEDEK
jgi:hypothetical protein